jgi:5-hydroxyisourate hydrolase
MLAKLSTHVLDTAAGSPAAGMWFELLRLGSTGHWEPLLRTRTNADGRCDHPLLEGDALAGGRYCLRFAVGEYFAGKRAAMTGVDATAPHGALPFLDQVPIEFGIADPTQSYHIPLLVSPWSYTIYRGS